MSRKHQPGDQVRRRVEYNRTRQAAVPADAIGTVIEVEDIPRMGPSYQMRVLFDRQAPTQPAFEYAFHYELVEPAPQVA